MFFTGTQTAVNTRTAAHVSASKHREKRKRKKKMERQTYGLVVEAYISCGLNEHKYQH